MAATALATGIVLLTTLNAAAQAPQAETTRRMMAPSAASDLRVSLNPLTQDHVCLTGTCRTSAPS
jgi:hypothetical protein